MRMQVRAAVAAMTALGLAAGGAPLWAQDLAPGQKKEARAARIAGKSPRLDGRLDDAVWRDAQWIDDFLQKEPVEGAPVGEKTAVAIAYDDDALWIAARMSSDNPSAIRKLMSARDTPGNTERLIVSLDTYGDHRTSYSFSVSVTGVRSDYYHPRDDEYARDFTYSPVWNASTAVDSTGWTLEIRLPFSQLRFNDTPQQVWGLNLNRWIPARNEDDFWVYVPRTGTGWASRFGQLVGIEGVKPSRRIELLPYITSSSRFEGGVASGGDVDSETRAGGDLKMGLGPNVTLDGTVSPDFGEVEADAAEVNLTPFETFFDDRRPFFTEGQQILAGNGPAYFYSRRVGGPTFGHQNTILGAAKVTGRLARGTSIGVLSAVTGSGFRDELRLDDRTPGMRTGIGVVRLQQEFGASHSVAGLSLTGVGRDFLRDADLRALLPSRAYSGGGDWILRFKGGEYEIGGSAGFSWLEGTTDAIARIQTSPAHYFQRPDQGHVEFDPTRTDLGGWTTNLRVDRRGGVHWLWSSGLGLESPGFELNDAGRLSSTDDIEWWKELRYRETKPGSFYRNYNTYLYGQNDFNFGGVHKMSYLETGGDLTWNNFWNTSMGLAYTMGGQSDDLTRGGPLFRIPPNLNLFSTVSGNFASTRQWNVSAGYLQNSVGSSDLRFGGKLSGRPGNRWELAVLPSYNHAVTARQYIAERAGGPPETFGRRYIYARIDRSTISAQVRATCGFSPNLTLAAYAEPFVATGRFDRFGEMRSARENRLRLYGTDGTTFERDAAGNITVVDGADVIAIDAGSDYLGDFRVLSFRSNFVLRWEWKPGSTFFLIWQNDRSQLDSSHRLARVSDLWDALGADGNDRVAAKLTYWFAVK